MKKARAHGWGGWRRLAAYAVLTVVPVVWLGVVLAATVSHESDRAAEREGQAQARAVVAGAIEPFLDGHPLSGGLTPLEKRRIAATSGSLLDRGDVLKLRIRDRDGRVLFDAASPDDGLGPDVVDQEVQEAVRDGIRIRITEVGADEVDAAADLDLRGVPAVEAYVALHAGRADRVVGVAELYLPFAEIATNRARAVHRLEITIAVGLAVLWLVLAGIVASAGTRVRRSREEAERLSLYDRLTGLPGRGIFADRVATALASCGRIGADAAVVVLDLDRFKEVNDTLGHGNGDALLRVVSERLAGVLRPGDTVARLGGDEFGIVLPGVRAETVDQILGRVRDVLAHDVELGGVTVSVEVCMGYAMWPSDAAGPEEVQQRADLALHAAKAARGAIVRYHPGIDEFDPQRLRLIAELRRGIGAGELELHYQPKIDAASGEVVAFEALVRWQHPVRGLLTPAEFIPIAESTGLIGPLTQWVLDRALAQLAEWRVSHPGLSMAVNVSARNLRDDLPACVLARLVEHAVPASHLVVEVTETSFAADPQRARAVLEELHAAGVRVSLDDFGEGFTSLGSLGQLPVSELKIDSGFVLAMGSSEHARAIVASVIELGHRLGLTVVAEGVETPEVRDELRRLHCDMMQGYLFSPAVPADRALGLVASCRQPA